MSIQTNFYNALIDWRFDQPNLSVNGKYVLSIQYMNQVLDHLKSIGYSGVTLETNVPVDVQTGKIQTTAYFGPDGKPMLPPEDHSLPKTTWSVVDLAKQKGFSVDLKLNIVDVNNDFPITKNSIANTFSTKEFFQSVTQYEKNIAIKAQEHKVDRIYVGVHQAGLDTEEFRSDWTNLIKEIKSVFSGVISYEGNYWTKNSPLYDLVDQIGLTFGYEAYLLKKTTDINEIINSYLSTVSQIDSIANAYSKPIILVGVHYNAADGGGFWTDLLSGKSLDSFKADYELQAARFDAFFNLLSTKMNTKIVGVDFRQYAPWQDSFVARYESGTDSWPDLKKWYLYCILDDNLAASPSAEAVISQYVKQPWGFRTYFPGTTGNDIFNGTQYADYFVGSSGNDIMSGGLGNDTLLYRSGKTQYDGGSGTDIIKVEAARLGFTLSHQTDGSFKLKEGTTDNYVSATNVERVKFNNNDVVALDIQGNAGQAYRLYKAALDRTPDANGLAGWIKYMDDGSQLTSMAQQFIDSQEFKTKYGALDNRNFVNQLYLNVLARNGELAGVDGWVGGLANGLTRAQVLVGFSESSENQTNVIGQIKDGIAFNEWWLA